MGLTGATDLLDLRAMDTAEDVIVKFIGHDMGETITFRLCPDSTRPRPPAGGGGGSKNLGAAKLWGHARDRAYSSRWVRDVASVRALVGGGQLKLPLSPVQIWEF